MGDVHAGDGQQAGDGGQEHPQRGAPPFHRLVLQRNDGNPFPRVSFGGGLKREVEVLEALAQLGHAHPGAQPPQDAKHVGSQGGLNAWKGTQ